MTRDAGCFDLLSPLSQHETSPTTGVTKKEDTDTLNNNYEILWFENISAPNLLARTNYMVPQGVVLLCV